MESDTAAVTEAAAKRRESKRSNDGFTVSLENNILDCTLATVVDSKLNSRLNWIQAMHPV